MKKIAVILLNLGGPDQKSSIRPFLLNFFTDKNIIPLPYPLRRLIAYIIAYRRGRGEALDSYDMLGGSSPLLSNTLLQAEALGESLCQSTDYDFCVFTSMRYWHPMSDAVVQDVEKYNPDEVILLPLYPQYSTTTVWSSFEDWDRALGASSVQNVPHHGICCYAQNTGFVRASAACVLEAYHQAQRDGHQSIRILFSAHGLPESIIEAGDPYQYQCVKSMEAIVQALGIDDVDFQICYQSRVGPKKWIGPSTEEALDRAVKDGVAVVIYPHAFVSEHVETLVEIEHEYREYAQSAGVIGFYRALTVGCHKTFIQGLRDLVMDQLAEDVVDRDAMKQHCEKEYSQCCMNRKSGLKFVSVDR